jgi:hypothetical protein
MRSCRAFMAFSPCLRAGVDVAADVEAVLGDVVAGQAAGDLLLGLERPDAAIADVVRGPDAGVLGEHQHVAAAVAAEFQQLAAGLLLRAVLRPGDAGHAGQAREDGVPELVFQRLPDVGGDGGLNVYLCCADGGERGN